MVLFNGTNKDDKRDPTRCALLLLLLSLLLFEHRRCVRWHVARVESKSVEQLGGWCCSIPWIRATKWTVSRTWRISLARVLYLLGSDVLL